MHNIVLTTIPKWCPKIILFVYRRNLKKMNGNLVTYFSITLETQYSPYLHFLSENDKVKRFLPLAVIATIKVEVSTNLKKNDNQIRKYLTSINTMCIQM